MADQKHFKVIDFDEGTFQLWDNTFGVQRKWRISKDGTTGLAMFVSGENSDLPKDQDEIDKKLQTIPEEEIEDYIKKMNKNSRKQIAVLASIVEPLEERPDIFDNKVEFLASCINEESAMKIYYFFLTKSMPSTMFQGLMRSENAKQLFDELNAEMTNPSTTK